MDHTQLNTITDVQTLRALVAEKLEIIAEHEQVIAEREHVIARHERTITQHERTITVSVRLRHLALGGFGGELRGLRSKFWRHKS